MTTQQIVFTGKNRAELLPETLRSLQPEEVLVKTSFSTVSCGTERANIMGNPNIAGGEKAEALNTDTYFPRTLGYSSAGIVVQTGTAVTSVIPGDRVVVFWGKHASYNLINESNYTWARLSFSCANVLGNHITGVWSPDSSQQYTSAVT